MVTKFTTIPLQAICRLRSFQYVARRSTHAAVEPRNLAHDSCPDLADLLQKRLNTELSTQTIKSTASIYRVPDRLRSVEPEAYEPNIVSIGPYHHGSPHLQSMDKTKWNYFQRLFHPNNPNRPDLNAVVAELKQNEQKARDCYAEDVKIDSGNFINMMLVDSCFVIELMRETNESDFSNKSLLIRRWMLPVLQRDLIMLENQLPLFVLNKVYNLISISASEDSSLKELALRFFEPMIYKDLNTPNNTTLCEEKEDDKEGRFLELFRASIRALRFFKPMIYKDLDTPNNTTSSAEEEEEDGGSHFLELFRASIRPAEVSQKRFPIKEPHMFRSATDLKAAGVKVKKAEDCQPLDVSFKKGVLKLAPVSMDDYRFTLFRNMVAFEQCHIGCKPYVTAYVFFLDRLINSAEDIQLLHYAGVMQHTLGGNKHAARLVNKLCIEVAAAVDDSYLHNVLWKINFYCNDRWNQRKAKLVHGYFYNVWVTLSTVAAIVIIYFTVLQTLTGFGNGEDNSHMLGTGFWISLVEAFIIPFRSSSSSSSSSGAKKPSKKTYVRLEDRPWIKKCSKRFLGSMIDDDINPLVFMP